MNKTLKVMTSAALLAGVVAPVAATTVSANSSNLVDKVLYVDDNYEAATAENSLIIKEDDVQFDGQSDIFSLQMPSGAKWLEDKFTSGSTVLYIHQNGTINATAPTTAPGFKIVNATETDLELEIANGWTTSATAEVKVPLWFEVDGGEGELKLTVAPKGSTLTGGQYTFAVVGEGSTVASISKVETIGDGGSIGTIRLDETSIGALYDAQYTTSSSLQEVKLRLPNDFKWNIGSANVSLGGGFSGGKVVASTPRLENDGRDLILEFYFTPGTPTKLGTFYISGLKVDADNDADFGEVEVDLSGDEVTSGSLVVANYKEYGTSVKVEDEVPTLIAGRNNTDTEDLEAVELTLKEEVPNSWLTGRSVEVSLPSWVKIVGAEIPTASIKNFEDPITGNGNSAATDIANTILSEITGDDNKIEFDMPGATSTTAKRELKVKLYVSVQANQEGDITATLGGRAGLEGEVVIAKAIKPVTVETTSTDVRTGIKGQAAADITITENAKEAFIKGEQVKVWLPEDIDFTNTPTVEVVEGNLEIDEDSIKKSGNELTFTIDSESTKPSKIKISNVKLTLDRTVPEGAFDVKVGGKALVQNDADGDTEVFGTTDFSIGHKNYYDNDVEVNGDAGSSKILTTKIAIGEFDQSSVVTATYGTVVTPAEGNVSAEEVKLVIGQGTMLVGNKEVEIDAAPFIEASTGRTYLPLRAIANAVGANSVEWDNASRTATVIKDGLVAQMTIGQNSYVLNGAKIGMDGKAQISKDRTFLPVRALGNALGATVEWDAATQTVTIK